MKDNKLISMTDFVIQQRSELMFKELGKACCKYATFLKQPLKLEMFVPCDEDGNVLEYKPNEDMHKDAGSFMAYEKAKEKVLFEGFEIMKGVLQKTVINSEGKRFYLGGNYNHKIEDKISHNLTLTQNAIKQIQP